jgi:hypothetical protein
VETIKPRAEHASSGKCCTGGGGGAKGAVGCESARTHRILAIVDNDIVLLCLSRFADLLCYLGQGGSEGTSSFIVKEVDLLDLGGVEAARKERINVYPLLPPGEAAVGHSLGKDDRTCFLGTTRVCPATMGNLSRKATQCLSS